MRVAFVRGRVSLPPSRSPYQGDYSAEDGPKAGGIPASWRPRYSSADNATRLADSSANDSSSVTAAAAGGPAPRKASPPATAVVPPLPGSPAPAQAGPLAVPPSMQVRESLYSIASTSGNVLCLDPLGGNESISIGEPQWDLAFTVLRLCSPHLSRLHSAVCWWKGFRRGLSAAESVAAAVHGGLLPQRAGRQPAAACASARIRAGVAGGTSR